MSSPIPAKEGHFWAKLKLHDNPDLNSVNWEVVQVFDNNGEGDEAFMVSVPGIEGSQPIDAFVWGPEVHRPEKIAEAFRKRADWLRSEYLKGGVRAHLEPREEECRRLASLFEAGRLP